MAERRIGVFADVLLGPLFGESYDMIITDYRLLLVHVAPFNMKWKPHYKTGRDLGYCEREDTCLLGARDKSVSIPYKNIRRIGLKKTLVERPAWYYLHVKYDLEDGERKKTKIMLYSPPEGQGFKEFAIEVQTALEKALPPETLAKGTWLS